MAHIKQQIDLVRYELHLFKYAPQSGEEIIDRSQAYYVIRAAQEKEELQQVGDALDVEITKAEKEIRGLTHTLRVLNEQNEKYEDINECTGI